MFAPTLISRIRIVEEEIPEEIWLATPRQVQRMIIAARDIAHAIEQRGIGPKREYRAEQFYDKSLPRA